MAATSSTRQPPTRNNASYSIDRSGRTRACNSPSRVVTQKFRPHRSWWARLHVSSTLANPAAPKPTGQNARLGSILACGRRVYADPWQFRICQGIPHRAQDPGNAPVPDRADLDQLDLKLHRRARPGFTAFLLKKIPRQVPQRCWHLQPC